MCQISDRFFAAVRTLTSDGPIKIRLSTAYEEHLATLRGEEVPESIKQKFDMLHQALNSVSPSNGESAVQASVRKMSPIDAQRYATSILLMLVEMVRVKGSGERLSTKTGRAAQATESTIPGVIRLRTSAN